MTSGGQVDATLARFNRKSPQDAYKQVCEELEVHYQREVYYKLPNVASAWHRVQVLELDNTLLGPKGSMALLPCVLVSTTLRKLTLVNTGLTDEFVIGLCNILQSHSGIRAVDVSRNELVSVFSASSIISLMKSNSNMVGFGVKGTHIGDNVGGIIAELGALNQKRVATYYSESYFKLKNIFGYLDEDGLGWVSLKSLILNCPYPILQEQFVERVAKVKPKKRSDNKIAVDTFMKLVYMNYKTDLEIAQYAKNKIDEPYVFMVANWKQIFSAAERYNAANEYSLVLPQDLHRLRIKDFLLTNEEADQVLFRAVSIQGSQDSEVGIGVQHTAPIHLETPQLLLAYRESCSFAENFRPFYQFYEERDPAYVPEAMRNGSRLFSINSLPLVQSNLNSTCSSPNASLSQRPSEAGETTDIPHTWHLAPSLVAMMVDFFNKTVMKLPKKKESAAVVDSPRTKKDKAMEKTTIPISEVLNVEFETDFEIIKAKLLGNYFAYFSLPLDSTSITLQELINIFDEMCSEVGVDKVLTNEQLQKLENPFEVEEYAEFLAQHLLLRENFAEQWIDQERYLSRSFLDPTEYGKMHSKNR